MAPTEYDSAVEPGSYSLSISKSSTCSLIVYTWSLRAKKEAANNKTPIIGLDKCQSNCIANAGWAWEWSSFCLGEITEESWFACLRRWCHANGEHARQGQRWVHFIPGVLPILLPTSCSTGTSMIAFLAILLKETYWQHTWNHAVSYCMCHELHSLLAGIQDWV